MGGTQSQPTLTGSGNPEDTLTGIDLVNYKCRRKHNAYKKCISDNYNKNFLGGKSMEQDEKCQDIFEAWQRCYIKGMRKEVWDKRRGGKPPKEGSALYKFEQEEKEDQEE